MNIRMSEGARRMRLVVEENKDGGQFFLKEVFTTLDGSWEPGSGPYQIEQWARDAYLRPTGAHDYFDEAGAAHNLFARVVDEQGRVLHTDVLFWSKTENGKPQNPQVQVTGERRSGWANIEVWSSFNPDRNERGAWRFAPAGAAHILSGAGLPHNWHVSTFAVWQRGTPSAPQEPEKPPVDPEPAPAIQTIFVTQPGTILRIHGAVPYRIEVVNG